ncbi:hypothetical protein [Methylocella sp.]|jgi:hypothetical protein|uniref:hypothetical protein n=1 Tax=Methylocella sp. TaxID=1978226 RepID=UPI003C191462
MTYSKRLSRLEARNALREPIEQLLIFTTFVAPDGSAVADYVILEEEGITIRRRFDESAEEFIERVRAEVRVIHKNSNVRGKLLCVRLLFRQISVVHNPRLGRGRFEPS